MSCRILFKLNTFLLVVTLTIFTNQLFAQNNEGIFFQAVARDNFSNPAKDRKIYVLSSIMQSNTTGAKVLIEEHHTNTDAAGMFSISLGNGIRVGGIASGLSNIEWANGPFYLNLKVAITPVSGNAGWDYTKEWVDIGTTNFGAVPYALYSINAGGVSQKLNSIDTTKMLAVYAKTSSVQSLAAIVDSKLAVTDTAAMLAPYAKAAVVLDSAYINAQLRSKISLLDSTIKYVTPTMLAAKSFDTTSLSNRIDLKADATDVDTNLASKLNISSTTSNNTANTIVKRDSAGNFAANIISGTLSGTATNANTLVYARNINGVSFDGSSDITVTADAGTLTGTTLANNVTNSSLTSVGTITNGTWSATLIDVTKGGTGTNNGSITGTAALTFTAGGTNQNVSILASGTGSVGVGTNSPTSSAALDVNSTTQGFLPPRLSTDQRNAIANPVEGLTIWNTTNKQLEVYDSLYWVNMNGKLVSNLNVGDRYGGGIVAYIFLPGDNGYVAGQTHGLIAAIVDQTTDAGVKWFPSIFYDVTQTLLGQGLDNTLSIIAASGGASLTNFAAGLASSYRGGGYTDWYLPSKDELNKLYLNRDIIGGFATSGLAAYWSSSLKGTINFKDFTEFAKGISNGWVQLFFSSGGDLGGLQKELGISNARRVRAVRVF